MEELCNRTVCKIESLHRTGNKRNKLSKELKNLQLAVQLKQQKVDGIDQQFNAK
jgi:hypothetical protein